MITFEPVPRPLDEVESEMTQSDSSSEAPTCRECVTTTMKTIDTSDKLDASANEPLRTLPPRGPYAMSVLWDEGPYDVASLFPKVTYCVRKPVVTSSDNMLTVARFFDEGSGQNLVNQVFSPPACRKSM